MRTFGLTDRGIERTENQDTFSVLQVPSRKCSIIALCDGMGGQNSGYFASELARRSFTDYVLAKLTSRINKNPDVSEVLRLGCEESNSVVFQYSSFTEEYNGMGSTLVGAVVYDSGKVFLANVGDSRAYLINAGKNEVRQITKDHSLVELYVDAGILTREQARTHKNKNIITRAIGEKQIVEPDLFELSLRKGDLLLLCSDGVSNYITDGEFLDCAEKCPEPEELCAELKRIVYSRGANDNLTLIAVMK
ncbi:MAG: protein phosphatase 2C domain-containing protein [Eubacteriales bacterium]|nr:protein phosphatase 2C domain-containing protein [Eubacteriales bacterium]